MEAHGSKKRKMAAEEDEEDDKVEEFFALIRSTREVRDRLRSNDHGHRQDKAVDVSRKESSVWNPTFRPEDFLDDRDHRDYDDKNKPSCLCGTSHRQSPPPPAAGMEVENQKLVEVGKVSGSNNNINNNINDNSLELDLKLSL